MVTYHFFFFRDNAWWRTFRTSFQKIHRKPFFLRNHLKRNLSNLVIETFREYLQLVPRNERKGPVWNVLCSTRALVPPFLRIDVSSFGMARGSMCTHVSPLTSVSIQPITGRIFKSTLPSITSFFCQSKRSIMFWKYVKQPISHRNPMENNCLSKLFQNNLLA